MRLTVFGATGGVGREAVGQALAVGHEVTAVVGYPARLPEPVDAGALRGVARLDDPAAVRAAVAGRWRGGTRCCPGSARGRRGAAEQPDHLAGRRGARDAGADRIRV